MSWGRNSIGSGPLKENRGDKVVSLVDIDQRAHMVKKAHNSDVC